MDHSQIIDDIYENVKDYNPTKKRKMLVVFDDITADMETYRTLSSVFTELLLRETKRNISFVLISKFYFKVPRTIRLNATHCFTMQITNKREFHQTASNHSSDTEFRELMKLCNDFAKEPFSSLANGASLPSGNSLRSRKKLS